MQRKGKEEGQSVAWWLKQLDPAEFTAQLRVPTWWPENTQGTCVCLKFQEAGEEWRSDCNVTIHHRECFLIFLFSISFWQAHMLSSKFFKKERKGREKIKNLDIDLNNSKWITDLNVTYKTI